MRLTDGGLWLDILKGAVLTLALFLAYVTFPLVGMLPGIFAPLPGLYYTCKQGAIVGGLITVVSASVLATLGGPPVALLYLLQGGVLALLLGALYRQGKGAAKALTYSVSTVFLLILALAIGYGALQGVDLYPLALKGIETSIAQTTKFYEQQGLKGEELEFLKQGMQQGGAFIARTFPALLLVSLASIAGLNLLALCRIAAGRMELPAPGTFKTFRNPEPLVWVVISAGFAMLVPVREVETIALNVLIVTVFMYFLQGMAVMQHLFDRYGLPRFMRVIVYLFLTLQPYLLLAVAAVGIFDLWGNFRAPRIKSMD